MTLNRPFARLAGFAVVLTIGICAGAQPPQSAATSYARAESLVREHQWDEGLAIIESLLKTTPQTAKILNLAGLAYIGKGDSKQAARYFESALKLSPDFVPALKNLAIDEVGMGQFEAAQRHLLVAEQRSSNDPVVNLYLGKIYYQQQDFKAAAKHLRRAESLVSRDPDIVASLAVSELKTGEKEHALETLDALPPSTLKPRSQLLLGLALAQEDACSRAVPYLEAASIASPSSTDISYDLALCYLAAKEYPRAIAALNHVIDQQHETSEVDNVLAEAYEGNHDTQAAVGALRRAIALSPDDDDNYLEFASLCMDHQAFDDAAKVLSVGLNVHPKSSRLIFERGILNAMQDHFEQAEKDFQLSADLAPGSNSGYIGLGVTYLETGKSAQAVPVLRKRLQDRPDDANLNYLLGEALLRSGAQPGQPTYTEAETSLQKAIRFEPGLVEPHISLGTIYLQQGELQPAVEELEQGRQLDAKSKSARSHLAVAYRRLGKPEKAREVLLELKSINDRERTGTKELARSPGPSEESSSPSPRPPQSPPQSPPGKE